ncbi:GGDEF domain-containing protein [Acidaminobacter sp. JC074]|uniref:GGDEF domain-containing protein n=1 Tax=Acidaminobacter sp. JC074 TaxID=2530199 RepID=UPI001F105E2F|nr:GGDEF domain-containing protein [Acidaminobacter sp. JC074]MCH4890690.1 GGDEF domain-containing protein [Acidaminobacter sp. JC074]
MKKIRANTYISYTLAILFILLLVAFTYMNYQSDLNGAKEDYESSIYRDLKSQADVIDARMAEIFDRAKLQKYWLEEITQESMDKIDLNDYTWTYLEDYGITSLDESNGSGSIYIHGRFEDLSDDQVDELKRILAAFDVQRFMLDHVELYTWSLYYTDMDILAGYPFTEVSEVFEVDSVSDLYDYVKDNIHQMNEMPLEGLLDGWENVLNYSYNEDQILFGKNWPVLIEDKAQGIFQSGFELEPLEDLAYMDKGHLMILDAAFQIVSDNGKRTETIISYDLDDSGFVENPYGKGLYQVKDGRLSYILDLEKVDWKLFYSLEDSFDGGRVYHYQIYLLFILISGLVLLRYIYRVNQKRIKEEKKLLRELMHDPLTDACNRNALDQMLDDFVEDQTNFCLAMLDIDDFKHINDTYGHGFGDKVLKQVVETIKLSLRSSDIVCRFGGEEFVLLFKDADLNLSLDISNRILRNITLEALEKLEVKVTVSIGLVMYKEGFSHDELLELADKHMYEAKKLGKNQVVYQENISFNQP